VTVRWLSAERVSHAILGRMKWSASNGAVKAVRYQSRARLALRVVEIEFEV
jgi:hypothetical protein